MPSFNTHCQPNNTHPINIPYQHTLSTHPINTPCQHTLSTSTHPINTPCQHQHTLSTHPVNINPINTPCQLNNTHSIVHNTSIPIIIVIISPPLPSLPSTSSSFPPSHLHFLFTISPHLPTPSGLRGDDDIFSTNALDYLNSDLAKEGNKHQTTNTILN